MIQNKDWTRMYDLIVDGKDGAAVARSIKDAIKAKSRYVAGLKLLSTNPASNWDGTKFTGAFEAFGNKALELGVTYDEIIDEWNNTPTPQSWIEKTKCELEATDFRGPFHSDNFWKQFRHAGIPVTTKRLPEKNGYYGIKIIFYENTYDQCSVDIRYNLNGDLAFEAVDSLDIEPRFIGVDRFLTDYSTIDSLLTEALHSTIMGDNLQ